MACIVDIKVDIMEGIPHILLQSVKSGDQMSG